MKALILVALLAFHISAAHASSAVLDWESDDFKTLKNLKSIRTHFVDQKWKKFYKAIDDKELRELGDGTYEYLIAWSLYKQELYVSSYAVLLEMIEDYPTSRHIDGALILVTENFKQGLIETSRLKDVLEKKIINFTEPEALSIVNYHQGLSLKGGGYNKWAVRAIKNIPKDTFWQRYFLFVQALKKSESATSEDMMKIWSEMSENKEIDGIIKKYSLINKARAEYELKRYNSAQLTYDSLSFDRFEQGEILREKAWVYYKLENYQEALATLAKLRSSRFGFFEHLDEYLISALIYRESCQVDMLKDLENNLQKKIKKVKAYIENLKDYSKNIDLISLSKFKTGVRDTAKMLYYLNEEKKSVKKIGNKRVRSLVAINNKRLMKNGINKLNNVIEDSIRQSIEESLILSEQISYLAYSVQLTPAKEKPLSYKKRLLERSKRASRNQVVWPVKSEIWSDEVPLYKSLLEKRCL